MILIHSFYISYNSVNFSHVLLSHFISMPKLISLVPPCTKAVLDFWFPCHSLCVLYAILSFWRVRNIQHLRYGCIMDLYDSLTKFSIFILFSINFARVFNTWFVFFNYYWVVSSCFHGIFSHNRKIILWSCKTITLNVELRLYFFCSTNCTFTYIEQHLTFCFLAS